MSNIFGQINTATDIETLVGATRVLYPTTVLQGIIDGGSGAYYYGLESKELGTTTTITTSSIGSTEKYMVGFLSSPFSSGYNTIPKGNFRVFLTAKQDSGTRTVTIYAKIYKVSIGGTETALLTTSSSVNLTNSYTLYEMNIASAAISILATDRIAVKFYTIGSASGTDAAVSIRFGTSAYEHVEMPSSNEIENYFQQTGWMAFPVTWTRTGNTTFTLTNDWTAYFRKGTKIRYKDGGSFEYGVVISSSFASSTTTVTTLANTDYAMAAATITDTYISYDINPEGWPLSFNWSPSWSNLTVNNGTVVAKWFPLDGNTIRFWIEFTMGSSSSITGSVLVTNPFTPGGISINIIGMGVARDVGVAQYPLTIYYNGSINVNAQNASGTNTTQGAVNGTTPFTFGTGDAIYLYFDFPLS